MSPVTHFFTGWVLGSVVGSSKRERAVITLAAVVPDFDGLGIIPELLTRRSQHPLLWFSQYHHDLHTLLFAIVVSSFAFFLTGRRCLPAMFAFASFHLHLIEDLVGSRGPDGFGWPIPYLFPFSSRWTWSWSGQWALNAWPNVVLTAVLISVTLWMAIGWGFSPVGIFSAAADRAVVCTLRKRFQRTHPSGVES